MDRLFIGSGFWRGGTHVELSKGDVGELHPDLVGILSNLLGMTEKGKG